MPSCKTSGLPTLAFNYEDSWEWGGFDEYGVHFVWCLHAITHAIRTYREAKKDDAADG